MSEDIQAASTEPWGGCCSTEHGLKSPAPQEVHARLMLCCIAGTEPMALLSNSTFKFNEISGS